MGHNVDTKLYWTQVSYRTQDMVQDYLLSNFCVEPIEFLTKICLLDMVCSLIRKYKLPFSFKAATPSSINKCL